MFSRDKNKQKKSGPKKAFTILLIVVLVGAVWVLANQKNAWKNVVASFQRSLTVDQQLDYQCRNLENERGQTRCENALEEVRDALEDYEGQLEEAQ